MAIVTRAGKGSQLTQAEGDTNWNTLFGINENIATTTHTVDHTDQGKTLEYSHASGCTVTLTAIATIAAADDSQISDFKVTLKNISAVNLTVNRSSTDTIDGGTSISVPQYGCVTLQTDSTLGKWNIIDYTIPAGHGKTFTSTDDKIDNFPSGTKMLFYQAAAPTGWTGDATAYDHALKLVASGSGGSTSGSVNFSTLFARTATDSHTLALTEIPAHSHSPNGYTYFMVYNGAGPYDIAGGGGMQRITSTDSQGGGGGHTHNIDMQVKYANVIIATKD